MTEEATSSTFLLVGDMDDESGRTERNSKPCLHGGRDFELVGMRTRETQLSASVDSEVTRQHADESAAPTAPCLNRMV